MAAPSRRGRGMLFRPLHLRRRGGALSTPSQRATPRGSASPRAPEDEEDGQEDGQDSHRLAIFWRRRKFLLTPGLRRRPRRRWPRWPRLLPPSAARAAVPYHATAAPLWGGQHGRQQGRPSGRRLTRLILLLRPPPPRPEAPP